MESEGAQTDQEGQRGKRNVNKCKRTLYFSSMPKYGIYTYLLTQTCVQ